MNTTDIPAIHGIMDLLFYICAGLLNAVSKITGYSYQETSVFINVYGQSLFLLFSALYLLFFAVKYLWRRIGVLLRLLPYIILQIALFAAFAARYFFRPNEKIFNDTMHSLLKLAEIFGISYNALNMILYIFIYCTVVLLNFYLAEIIKKSAKSGTSKIAD